MDEKEFVKKKSIQLRPVIKKFPRDFIAGVAFKKLDLPGNPLLIGKSFFGSIEVTTPDGTPCYISENPAEAKYIVYSRNNGVSEIEIPEDNGAVNYAVSSYEQYLDSLMKEIRGEFLKLFPDRDPSQAVASVFRLLNLVRY